MIEGVVSFPLYDFILSLPAFEASLSFPFFFSIFSFLLTLGYSVFSLLSDTSTMNSYTLPFVELPSILPLHTCLACARTERHVHFFYV